MPDTETIKKLLNNFVEQFRAEIEGGIKQIDSSVSHIPREVAVTGDVYGFTTLKAALVYVVILITIFLFVAKLYLLPRPSAGDSHLSAGTRSGSIT